MNCCNILHLNKNFATHTKQVIFRRLQSNNLLGTVRLLYFTVSFQLECIVSGKRQHDSGQHAVGNSGVPASCQWTLLTL